MKIVLAYSGGTDSAYLKQRLLDEGHMVFPVMMSVPDLSIPEVAMNRRDRCYHCKLGMFRKLKAYAKEIGADCVMDGTNADDLKVNRPGLRALRELAIRSPLADAGLTKADVRRLAAEAGLSVATKPASPCYATRFPYDTPLSEALLKRVEDAERGVRKYLPPDANLRVRCEGDVAKVETDLARIPVLRDNWKSIVAELKSLDFAEAEIAEDGFVSGRYD